MASTPVYNKTGIRTEICVSFRYYRNITDDALKSLYQTNDKKPYLFLHASKLTRISIDEHGPHLEELSEPALRGYLERAADYYRIVDVNNIPTPPPTVIVKDIMSLQNLDFPLLAGITEVPIIRKDGTILMEPGHDTITHLYYQPQPGLIVPEVNEHITESELESAIELISDPLADFPFDSDASRANALATMITPVLRPIINGPIPLAIFDKPQAGVGASLLAEVISIIATGRAAPMMTARKDDDEWRKSITALLLRGQLVINIDNVEGALEAPSLASVLTSTTYQDRILSRSEMVTIPNNATWIATGNNIRLGGDLPRRCIWVRMNSKTARPWLRDTNCFKHPELRTWVEQSRGLLLAAILTVARAWVLAGMPQADTPKLGGYADYCRVLGGVLSFMHVNGFLGNTTNMYEESDQETPQWELFLEQWLDIFGNSPVTASEIENQLNCHFSFRSTLPDCISDINSNNYSVRLGQSLSKKNGVHFPNGMVLLKAGQKHRAVTWQVLKAGTSPEFSIESEVGEVKTNAKQNEETENGNSSTTEGVLTSPDLTVATKSGEVEFVPSDDWQEVSGETPIPPGLEIRMDFTSGKNFVRKQASPVR